MIEAFIFVVLQSMAMNGFQQAMDEGMILHPYKKWLQRRPKWFSMPMGLCVKCLASVGSLVTFWPVVLYSYGFKPFEFFAWGMDIFVLVFLNAFFYKKG
jgi:hypothetical protein